MSSIGAKYCYLNRVSPIIFGKIIQEYLPPIDVSRFAITVDVPGFKLDVFARLIGENVKVLRSQSSNDLVPGPLLAAAAEESEPSFESLQCCQACLACGFHSVLHQLPWIRRCFIHDTPLVSAELRSCSLGKGLPRDIRFVTGLFDLWFGRNSPWPEAKLPQWNIPSSTVDRKRIAEMQRAFHHMETALRELENEHHHIPIFIARPGGNRLRVLARILNCDRSKWEEYAGTEHGLQRHVLINCTESQAEFVLAHNDYWLQEIQEARRYECKMGLEQPRWVIELEELIHRMSVHHRDCEKAVEELSIRWPIGWFDQGPRDAAIALYEYRIDICRRLPLLALLHHAITIYSAYGDEKTWANEILHEYEFSTTSTCSKPNSDGTQPIASLPSKIADELLLAWVWSIGWVLYELECDLTYHEATDYNIVNNFNRRVAEKLSSVSVLRHKAGLKLIMQLRTPRRLPSWSHLDRSSVSHRRNLETITMHIEKLLEQESHERKQRMREACSLLPIRRVAM